ncbi:hypothetical protein CCUS01_10932 [Colletotrichum cuscutae]|uniref:Uncharacterized protein n=1 Tax=Colletotrichum cuscutae TaxID=1209917 RepID=A0AAI9U8A5_9PEZI|nr:hypothetical protein CCUS01_10932 [Colletotrichum cuscutae]
MPVLWVVDLIRLGSLFLKATFLCLEKADMQTEISTRGRPFNPLNDKSIVFFGAQGSSTIIISDSATCDTPEVKIHTVIHPNNRRLGKSNIIDSKLITLLQGFKTITTINANSELCLINRSIYNNTKLLFSNTTLKRPTLFTGRNDDTHNLLETKMFPQRRTSTTFAPLPDYLPTPFFPPAHPQGMGNELLITRLWTGACLIRREPERCADHGARRAFLSGFLYVMKTPRFDEGAAELDDGFGKTGKIVETKVWDDSFAGRSVYREWCNWQSELVHFPPSHSLFLGALTSLKSHCQLGCRTFNLQMKLAMQECQQN